MNTLGYVNITAGGTPQPLAAAPALAPQGPGKRCAMVVITVKPGNAGVVYIGKKAMNTGTGVGVAAALAKPASATTGPFDRLVLPPIGSGGGYNLNEIYIDGTTNDGVYVAYL